MAKVKKEKGAEENVLPKDQVKVKWLAGAKHHKEGETSILHRIQADKFVEAKKAEIVEGFEGEKTEVSKTDGQPV